MQRRTDLAIEAVEGLKVPSGDCRTERREGFSVTTLTVDEQTAKRWERPAGQYITVELADLTDEERQLDAAARVVAQELTSLLPADGTVLVVGLGNDSITPDALGPESARRVLATRHIRGEFARSTGLADLRPVTVLTPGVLGNTGIESSELVAGVCTQIAPAAVIAVDALAAGSLSRLGRTVQLSDTGIAPGSGVGNHRRALTRDTLGVPVIAVGIPTVVGTQTIARELAGAAEQAAGTGDMMVTPREVDLLIRRAAQLIALAVNGALQPAYSPRDLMTVAV